MVNLLPRDAFSREGHTSQSLQERAKSDLVWAGKTGEQADHEDPQGNVKYCFSIRYSAAMSRTASHSFRNLS